MIAELLGPWPAGRSSKFIQLIKLSFNGLSFQVAQEFIHSSIVMDQRNSQNYPSHSHLEALYVDLFGTYSRAHGPEQRRQAASTALVDHP